MSLVIVLGQVVGCAAAKAIDENKPASKIDIVALRKILDSSNIKYKLTQFEC